MIRRLVQCGNGAIWRPGGKTDNKHEVEHDIESESDAVRFGRRRVAGVSSDGKVACAHPPGCAVDRERAVRRTRFRSTVCVGPSGDGVCAGPADSAASERQSKPRLPVESRIGPKPSRVDPGRAYSPGGALRPANIFWVIGTARRSETRGRCTALSKWVRFDPPHWSRGRRITLRQSALLPRQFDRKFAVGDAPGQALGIAGGGILPIGRNQFAEGRE